MNSSTSSLKFKNRAYKTHIREAIPEKKLASICPNILVIIDTYKDTFFKLQKEPKCVIFLSKHKQLDLG